MDAENSLNLNGRLSLRRRLVRDAGAVARIGWADRSGAGQFLKTVGSRGKQAGDFRACVALSTCPQEFNPITGWHPTDLLVGVHEPA